MGIHSVAVYSDIDRGALHTTVADEAYHLGPTPASESYLNIERLIDVAKRSGAEAVHPGYGFLAESAAFARAVTEAGLVWIGPHPEAIVAMGSKVESRRIMARTGVPITPGTEEPVDSPDAVLEFATEHRFPVAGEGVDARIPPHHGEDRRPYHAGHRRTRRFPRRRPGVRHGARLPGRGEGLGRRRRQGIRRRPRQDAGGGSLRAGEPGGGGVLRGWVSLCGGRPSGTRAHRDR